MTGAHPAAALTASGVTAQSLSSGTAGRALLAIERACNGSGDWDTAARLIGRAAAGPIDAGPHAGLYYGAPAISFVLNTAAADGRDRYAPARRTLDRHIRGHTRRRLAAAGERLRTGAAASFAEYDLFGGLVGLGALLLRQQPGSDELGDVLLYLVRLTEPRRDDGLAVPGWWVDHHPDPTLPTPGGHANNGMAHGAAGLLALLAHATRRQIEVAGQADAIGRLCAWFDRWQQESAGGTWWPQWVTREHLRTGRVPPGPGRASWCYGTPGIARAQQLAALATGDRRRQRAAENAIAACLTDTHTARLTEPGICHGLAGLYQTAARAAADTADPAIRQRLPALAARLTAAAAPGKTPGLPIGFLTGRTGASLVADTIRTGQPPRTEWDTCLLIT
jgi:lantibiotic biosynthesis protein